MSDANRRLMVNHLYFGDNLDILREYIKNASVDLIYLDPPFNSKANYNILFTESETNGSAQIKAFEDTWHWGDEAERTYEALMQGEPIVAGMIESLWKFLGKNDVTAYLVMMTVRLVELYRVLKSTGSIYLHCDPTASHYLKIIMDVIFDKKNYRNEIVWCYTGPSGAKYNFPKKHDVLLRYTKSDVWTFNADKIRIPYKELHSDSGKNSVIWGTKGKLQDPIIRQQYFERGKIPPDFWTDIPSGGHISPYERLDYPTQKPLALLERIVESSSEPGHLVLDPFCGCGTALLAAQKLGRSWIGIDITHLAIGLIEQRLASETKERPRVLGSPQAFPDARNLFERDPWQFEAWAVSRLPRIFPKERERKKGADHGVDGIGRLPLEDGSYAKILAQVKGGKNLGESMIRDFMGTIEIEQAQAGVFIVLSQEYVTPHMKTKASQAGRFSAKLKGGLLPVEAPKIQIWSIEEYFQNILPSICINY